MKTIGAKELRLHLNQVLDRVLAGEDIIVSHRFKAPIKLSALSSIPNASSEKLAGLRAFDAAPKRKVPYDKRKPVKDLYDESITQKYLG
jgi:antitoxin (DNA-binding transcriptional repressor) of toxin-antitoxin stability system